MYLASLQHAPITSLLRLVCNYTMILPSTLIPKTSMKTPSIFHSGLPLGKNIYQRCLVALATLAVVFTACQDPNFPDPNNPSPSTASLQNLASGVLGSSRGGVAFYTQITAIFGREAYNLDGADPAWTGNLVTGQVDAGGAFLTTPWNTRYATIGNCRNLITAAGTLSASDKAATEGFANTILAYSLLLNLNLTYDNGIKIVFSEDIATPFASRADAFADIVKRLDDAYTSLQQGGSAFPFALTRGYAGFNTPTTFGRFNRALRARVAAYMGDYATVTTALNASFLSEAGDLTTGVYHVYSTTSGDLLNPIYEPPTAASVKFVAHPSFITDAEAGDKRVAAKVIKRPAAVALNGLSSEYGITVAKSNIDPFPLIRNEELILLKAEAALLGASPNYAEGTRLLNIVRKSAGLSDLPTLTASNALNALIKERRYSLFVEGGHRWIDARRFNRLGGLPIDRTGDAPPSSLPRPVTEVSGS